MDIIPIPFCYQFNTKGLTSAVILKSWSQKSMLYELCITWQAQPNLFLLLLRLRVFREERGLRYMSKNQINNQWSMYSTVCIKRIRRVLTVVYNECVLAIKLEYTFQTSCSLCLRQWSSDSYATTYDKTGGKGKKNNCARTSFFFTFTSTFLRQGPSIAHYSRIKFSYRLNF